jgi:hypothetical protein
MAKRKRNKGPIIAPTSATPAYESSPDFEPDWEGGCDVCGSSPIVPATGMCGPCTFGEADTAGGNW